MASVMAVAEQIIKLQAVCELCSEDAYFTLRRSVNHNNKTSLELIGGKELYSACCRACFLQHA